MQRRVQDGFRILLHTAAAVQMFRDKLKISHIAEVYKMHRQPHLILNLLEKPNEGKPSVNYTTNRYVELESIQFG